MALSAEQRAQISRINGSKSRGPVTMFGRMASRRSALVHGGRAKVLLMDDESPQEIASLSSSQNRRSSLLG